MKENSKKALICGSLVEFTSKGVIFENRSLYVCNTACT